MNVSNGSTGLSCWHLSVMGRQLVTVNKRNNPNEGVYLGRLKSVIAPVKYSVCACVCICVCTYVRVRMLAHLYCEGSGRYFFSQMASL